MNLIPLAERCDNIISHLLINRKQEWVIKFDEIFRILRQQEQEQELIEEHVRRENPRIFYELDNQFNNFGGSIRFINYILERHPYPGFERDRNRIDFRDYNVDLLNFLKERYHPEPLIRGNRESELRYCLMNEILQKISDLLTRIR